MHHRRCCFSPRSSFSGLSGRVRPRRALLVGILIGLATSVQLWQGLSALVLLWWIVVRAPRAGRRLTDGWRSVATYMAGAAGAFAVVCAPFVLAAPWNAVRYTLFDQLGRPNTGIGLSERLSDIVPRLRRTSCPLRFVSWRPRRGWWDSGRSWVLHS